MIEPKYLCRQHLLGEHGEIHKFRHNFVKQHKIDKRIKLGQIEPESMKTRHDELVIEMLKRGYNHKSPYELPDLSYLYNEQRFFKVDIIHSMNDLINRCEECKKLIKGG